MKRKDSSSQKWSRVVFACVCLWFIFGALWRIGVSTDGGYAFDVGVNKNWGLSAVEYGIAGSYERQVNGNMQPNYPPLSIGIFSVIGHVFQTLRFMGVAITPSLSNMIMKIPANVADLGITILLYFFFMRMQKKKSIAIAGALIYWVNPAVIYDSAIWGQTDSVYSFFALLSMYFLLYRSQLWAGVFLAFSVLCKPQGIIFLPLFAMFLFSRPKELLRFGLGFIGGWLLVLIPFFIEGNVHRVFYVYKGAVGYYPTLASGAYNFWWILFADQVGGKKDLDLMFGLISYRMVGLLLFSCFYAIIPLRLMSAFKKKVDANMALLMFAAATVVAYAFFSVNTQMHERYAFPVMAFALPLAFASKKLAWTYILAIWALYMNLAGILQYGSITKMLYAEFPLMDVVVAIAHMAALLLFAGYLWKQGSWEYVQQIFTSAHRRFLTSKAK